jgi:23S rRNA pseudouridine1911/1915/1917 synthase
MSASEPFTVPAEHAEKTLAALLRVLLPGQSWRQVERVIATRRVRLGGDLCLDPARRVHLGEKVEVLDRPAAGPRRAEGLVLRYLDEHIVVVEKPAGLNTVRHPAERDWSARRKALSPTLEDLLPVRILERERDLADRPQRNGPRRPVARSAGGKKRPLPRLRVVHRLDKDTSGLVVFARTVEAERGLGRQFKAHTVIRRYLAVAEGRVRPGRIESWLVRDRGDKRRGSSKSEGQGKKAVTHVEVKEHLPGYTLVACRLETGRTHQIRIHLAESGHPLCGDPVYRIRPDGSVVPDRSGATRLALHAAELGFQHPVTGEQLHWTMPLPADLDDFLTRLRAR